MQVPDDHCFIGFDAYKKLLDSDVDIMINATPPHFRQHPLCAAVEAKDTVPWRNQSGRGSNRRARHPGRQVRKPTAYNLSVVTGTQRRHDRAYQDNL